MKGHQWDDNGDGSDIVGDGNESARDFFDSVALLQDGDYDAGSDKRLQKRRLTELRRRAEERLDWKRLYGDLDFDDYSYDLDDDGQDLQFEEH